MSNSFARAKALLEQVVAVAGQVVQAKAPDVALAVIERAFVGDVIEFDARVRRSARAAGPTIRKAARTRNWATFPRAQGRLPFLAATRSFLASKKNEWIVVGLGTWQAHRSTVRETFAWEGRGSMVRLPDSVDAEAAGHLRDGARAEILHVHNHPAGVWRDIKNFLVGDAPIPSAGDRQNLLQHIQAAAEANAEGGARRARFYLVENGQLHEYTLPPWPVLRPLVNELLEVLRQRG